MNILITGINGFLGKNLAVRLNENDDYKISGITRDTSIIETKNKVSDADLIFHLAGENRSNNNQDFVNNNHLLTKLICCLSEEKRTYQLFILPQFKLQIQVYMVKPKN